MLEECLPSSEPTENPTAETLISSLGDMDHPPTYFARLHLLGELLLNGSNHGIRDAALTGLSNIDDPVCLMLLAIAYDKETNPLARRFIRGVIEQLERTQEAMNGNRNNSSQTGQHKTAE